MRTPSENSPPLSTLTQTAVARGIIDAAQRDALHALASEMASAERPIAPRPEARGNFNVITIAYALGALLVLFALGWFLAERWSKLGPGGVLIVAGLYAVAFAAAGLTLRRRGFAIAGGLAVVLAVVMTPVWGWAVLRLTGLWPDPDDFNDPLARFEPYITSRLIILDLATIGVALVAVRRIRFFALGAPIAVAFVALLVHLGQALGDPRLSWYVGPYYQVVIACATLAIAYAVDRRQPPREDYALWFYLAGSVMLFAGYVQVWSHIGAWRHATPLVAAALVAASLYLRRRVLVIAGGVAAFGYLGYLAFDVFRRVVALPIALAALGLLVIVATVWMQRRFPSLVARVNRDDDGGRKTLPTGPIAVLGPLAIALTAMLFAASEARERTAEQDWRNAFYNRRATHEMRAQQAAERARRAPTADAPR
jgi:hypothetical protein